MRDGFAGKRFKADKRAEGRTGGGASIGYATDTLPVAPRPKDRGATGLVDRSARPAKD